jgi:hypothetical protein
MKEVLVAIGMLAAAMTTWSAQPLTIKGQLVLNPYGQVTECGSGRVLRFGVMASNPYFHLLKRFEEASGGGKQGVLIEVSGTLAIDSSGNEVLENPTVLSVVSGTCSNG